MKIIRLALLPTIALVILCSADRIAAEGPPVAEFPEQLFFTPDEIPTDVAVDKVGNVYVSVIVSNLDPTHAEIWKFSPTGEKTVLVQFDTPHEGLSPQLEVDAMGNVYVTRHIEDQGVYVVDKDGVAVLLPGTEEIYCTNGLAFDKRGNLYIASLTSLDSGPDSCVGMFGQGGIYRFPKGGTEAEPWFHHELLTGNCPPGIFGIPCGTNDVQFYNGSLYALNWDKSTIVEIPIQPNGDPGEPTVWATLQPVSEAPFPGSFQYFAFDVHGNAYVVYGTGAIVRINARDMSQETIAYWPLAPLDTPGGIAFGTGKGGRTSIFITNFGWMALWGIIPEAPGPSLMKLDVGIPGLPLP